MSYDMLRRLVAYEFRKIHSYPMTITGFEQALNEVLIVQPEQKTGRWIEQTDTQNDNSDRSGNKVYSSI